MKTYPDSLFSSSLFSGIVRADAEKLLSCMSPRFDRFARDAYVHPAGEPFRHAGLVASGSVLLIHEDIWGEREILSRKTAGELFGEAWALVNAPGGELSVVAAEPCEILFLPVQKMMRTCSPGCACHTALIENFTAILAGSNLQLSEKITCISKRTIRQRLLAYLSAEATRRGASCFTIPFDRQQLADYLSVDRSALSAELGRMQRNGLIEVQRNFFCLHADKARELL